MFIPNCTASFISFFFTRRVSKPVFKDWFALKVTRRIAAMQLEYAYYMFAAHFSFQPKIVPHRKQSILFILSPLSFSFFREADLYFF